MEKWMKKRAALYMLIKLIDENNGCIIVNNDKVKRVYNDTDDIVRIEYINSDVALLADADFDTMNNIIMNFQQVKTK